MLASFKVTNVIIILNIKMFSSVVHMMMPSNLRQICCWGFHID